MSLYRCAACGSPNVKTDTHAGGIGYNYKKGAIGTVLLGAGGAAAGIESKTQQVFVCPDCGTTLTYCMPEEIKMLIDLGVSSLNARNSLKLRGQSMPWSFITSQYKNIESGNADRDEALRKEQIVDNIEQFNRERSKEYRELQALSKDPIVKELKQIVSNMNQNSKSQEKNEYKKHLEEYNATIKKLENDKSRITKEISDYQFELSELGFFKKSRKRELSEKIESFQHSLKDIENKIKNTKKPQEPSEMDDALKEQVKMIAYRAIQHYGALSRDEITKFAQLVNKNINAATVLSVIHTDLRTDGLVCKITVKGEGILLGKAYYADAISYKHDDRCNERYPNGLKKTLTDGMVIDKSMTTCVLDNMEI